MPEVQSLLNQLAALVGVHGAFTLDQRGRILAYSTPMKISREQGLALAKALAGTLSGLSTIYGSSALDLDLVFGEGRLILKGIASGGLCIICDRQANYSLLSKRLEESAQNLRETTPESEIKDAEPQALDGLKAIALELLGEHASKVIAILESAGSDAGSLNQAVKQAEQITRMFIDKERAGMMAERMRAVIEEAN